MSEGITLTLRHHPEQRYHKGYGQLSDGITVDARLPFQPYAVCFETSNVYFIEPHTVF